MDSFPWLSHSSPTAVPRGLYGIRGGAVVQLDYSRRIIERICNSWLGVIAVVSLPGRPFQCPNGINNTREEARQRPMGPHQVSTCTSLDGQDAQKLGFIAAANAVFQTHV